MEQETVTVVYGEENFFPAKYQGFTVGPYTYTTKVKLGETPDNAVLRANKVLHDLADALFTRKRNAFIARLETLHK